jgi:hydrogenase-4 component F
LIQTPTTPVAASYAPMYVHFALVLVAGIYLPPMLVVWFQHISVLLG